MSAGPTRKNRRSAKRVGPTTKRPPELVRGLYVPIADRRIRQEVEESYSASELAWAAGLFAGEGYAYTQDHVAKRTGATTTYPALQLKMLDARSVERFADVFGMHFR